MDPFNKIDFHQEIQEFIEQLDSSEKKRLSGVLSMLENDYWRDTNKIYFGEVKGVETWAIAEGGFTLAFDEEEDGTIFILFLNKRSRFRPSWP